MPIFYPSFVFEAPRGLPATFPDLFPDAIAQGMAICKCSGQAMLLFYTQLLLN